MTSAQVVFYLWADNEEAKRIVDDPRNKGRQTEPKDELEFTGDVLPFPEKFRRPRGLKVCLDAARNPPTLAKFGRGEDCDIFLPTAFPRKQCVFRFNQQTGELLLQDYSDHHTSLAELIPNTNEKRHLLHGSSPPECAIVLIQRAENGLPRGYEFCIGNTRFLLYPGPIQHYVARYERAQFASAGDAGSAPQDLTDEIVVRIIRNHGTATVAADLIQGMNIQSTQPTANPNHGPQTVDRRVHYADIKPLNRIPRAEAYDGNEVAEVMGLRTGMHFACKRITKKTGQANDGFHAAFHREMAMMRSLSHARIIEIFHSQAHETAAQKVEYFMPLYDGCLSGLICMEQVRKVGEPRSVAGLATFRTSTARMAVQILGALEYIHSQPTPIIHMNVNPRNILVKAGNSFVLSDFGVARSGEGMVRVTEAGKKRYMGPGVLLERRAATGSDVYALGITLLECLADLPFESNGDVRKLHRSSQFLLQQFARSLGEMLGDRPGQRPTAKTLREMFFRVSGTGQEDELLIDGTVFESLSLLDEDSSDNSESEMTMTDDPTPEAASLSTAMEETSSQDINGNINIGASALEGSAQDIPAQEGLVHGGLVQEVEEGGEDAVGEEEEEEVAEKLVSSPRKRKAEDDDAMNIRRRKPKHEAGP